MKNSSKHFILKRGNILNFHFFSEEFITVSGCFDQKELVFKIPSANCNFLD